MADAEYINGMNNLQLAVNEAVARVFDAMRQRDYATAQREWAFIAGYVEDEFVTQPLLQAAAPEAEPLNEAEIAAIEAEFAELPPPEIVAAPPAAAPAAAPVPDARVALWAAPRAIRQGHTFYDDSDPPESSAEGEPRWSGSGIP